MFHRILVVHVEKKIILNPLNNISYTLDLKNQFLHEFFNNSLQWGGGGTKFQGGGTKTCFKTRVLKVKILVPQQAKV